MVFIIRNSSCGRPSLLDMVADSGDRQKVFPNHDVMLTDVGLPFAIVQNIFENFSVQCQLVIEATMKARQRWSKNNALAELCRGDWLSNEEYWICNVLIQGNTGFAMFLLAREKKISLMIVLKGRGSTTADGN